MGNEESRGFTIVDVDSHVYEPEAVWTDYLDEGDAARRAFARQADGVVLNDMPAKPLNRSKINRQAIWRPGMTPTSIGELDPNGDHEANPGAWDPVARLADLDALGIDHQVVFPTLFGEYFPAVQDRDAAVVLARAYNDWASDFAQAGEGRLHPAAVIPLQDVAESLAELDRCASRGFKSVLLRPMFLRNPDGVARETPSPLVPTNPNGVFIDNAAFRPIWKQIEHLGLVACVHPYLGIANTEGTSGGSFVERVSDKLGIGHTVAEPVAYMQDNAMFVVIAMFHGLLEDYPTIKLALLHAGGSMVPLAIEKAETYLWLSPGSMIGAAPVCLEPEEVFERSSVLVGFDGWESSVPRLGDFFATKGAWGSRYPYHDASTPAEVIAVCERYHAPTATVERLVGANAGQLFGLGVPTPA
jgi:predicted TIM-barrel fold metal-dependent hydrolase